MMILRQAKITQNLHVKDITNPEDIDSQTIPTLTRLNIKSFLKANFFLKNNENNTISQVLYLSMTVLGKMDLNSEYFILY